MCKIHLICIIFEASKLAIMNIQKTNSGVKIYLTDAERLGVAFSLVNLLGETGIELLDLVQKNNIKIALSEPQKYVLSEFLNLLRHG